MLLPILRVNDSHIEGTSGLFPRQVQIEMDDDFGGPQESRGGQGTAAVGGTLSLLALVGPVPRQALPFGALMALVLWLTALYLLVHADGIALRRAARSY